MNTLALVVSGILAASDGRAFQEEQPRAQFVMNKGGWITIATNLSTRSFGTTPEEAARGFLKTYGSAFGLPSGDEGLVLSNTPQAGEFATLIFNRAVDGLPVINGQVMVAVTPEGRIHAASSSGPLPFAKGAFLLNSDGARFAALARLEGEVKSIKAGWSLNADSLQPVYIVGIVATHPSYQSHRFVVDAMTGAIGMSPSLLQYNRAKVYGVSPSKPAHPAPACPTTTDMNGNVKYNTCAMPEEVMLQGLAPGAQTLTGDPMKGVGRTTVYNCKGGTAFNTQACTQTLMADSSGNYFPMLDFGTNKNDSSSELMAYYHVDRHSRFMDSLDRNFAGLPLIPGFTNAYGPSLLPIGGPSPMDNAFYDPQNRIMVFGQGSTVDFAFDAEVVYHEVTHAACDAIGRIAMSEGALFPIASSKGLFVDPFSINEGNADTFAVMEPNVQDPLLGEFDARTEISLLPFLPKIPIGPKGYIRNLAPPVPRTCQGNGTAANPGRDAESHDDGEIWGGFAWQVFQGLQGLPNAAQQPGGAAAASVMMKALQAVIALPLEQQGFTQFANLVSSQTRAMYGNDAGDYVDCLKARHDIAGCDGQTVTVYSGEAPFNDMTVQGAWKAFYFSRTELYGGQMLPANFEGVPSGLQWKIAVPAGATELELKICDLQGSGRVFLQKDRPVTMNTTGSGMMADFTFPIPASRSADFGGCGGGLLGNGSPLTLKLTPTGCTVTSGNGMPQPCRTGTPLTGDNLAAGDWYVLATNSGQQASFAKANFKLTAPTVPTRPAPPPGSPMVCVLKGAVTPPDAGPVPPIDAGRPSGMDAGMNPSTTDAGSNPGNMDAGMNPGTTMDAGQEPVQPGTDAGPTMMVDAGKADGGTTCVGTNCGPMKKPCGCSSGAEALAPFALGLLGWSRRRRRA